MLPVAVVVEGPKGCRLLAGFSCVVWWGEVGTPKVARPDFRLWKMPSYICSATRVYLICTNDGSKRVISRKDVPLGLLTSLNFGRQIPQKMKFWAHAWSFQAWTTEDSNTYNLNITKTIMKKFLQRMRPSWVVIRLPATNPRWRSVGKLNFVKSS